MSSLPQIAPDKNLVKRPEANLADERANAFIPQTMIGFFRRYEKFQEQAALPNEETTEQS